MIDVFLWQWLETEPGETQGQQWASLPAWITQNSIYPQRKHTTRQIIQLVPALTTAYLFVRVIADGCMQNMQMGNELTLEWFRGQNLKNVECSFGCSADATNF